MNSSRLLSLAAFVLLFAGQSVAVVAAAAAAAAAVPAAAAPGAASRNLPSSTSPPPPPSIITTTNRANTHPAFVASLQLGQAQQRLLSGPPSSSRWTSSSASVSASKKSGYSQRAGAGLGDDGVAVKAAAEPQEPEGPTLGFVGAGMMATAMINGIIASKVTKPENIVVSAAHQASLDRLKPAGVRTSESNAEVAAGSDVVILAVKPDILPSVLREIEPQLSDDALVMSIAAGIQLPVLEKLVPGKRVVRVMPNTPCLVSEGACGFSLGAHATDKDREVAHSLLGAVGYACEVKEPLLDALTGVSGSGPAYIFVLIEALADGGVRMGLPRDLAIKLAAQTVKGAAAMVLETGEHPAVLKDQVCSPGGLTIAAIESLEKDGFRAAAMSAVITVASKSIEMREGGIK